MTKHPLSTTDILNHGLTQSPLTPEQEALVPFVAMRLYQYNVGTRSRALSLLRSLQGAFFEEVLEQVGEAGSNNAWGLEWPQHMANAYLRDAMKAYGEEARNRVRAEAKK